MLNNPYPNGGPMGAVKAKDVYHAILAQAHAAAQKAVADKGPENMKALDCGMAWVIVKPMSHPFIQWCKRSQADNGGDRSLSVTRLYGDKHMGRGGGWRWYKPGWFDGQAIGHHEAGAQAFAKVLCENLIGAEVICDSRLD